MILNIVIIISLIIQENLNITLRANHEKLEEDYYKLGLDFQETKASLQKIEKLKDALGKYQYINTNTNTITN